MKNGGRQGARLNHWQHISHILVVYDVLAIAISFFLALWFRFECSYGAIPDRFLKGYLISIPIYIVVSILAYAVAKLYRSIWRFASYHEMIRLALASFSVFCLYVIVTLIVHRMPVSYYLAGYLLQFCSTLGVRFSYRLVLLLRGQSDSARRAAKRIMIIGAGSAGQALLRDINHSLASVGTVVCMIDDNPNKWNRFIDGVPVVGGRGFILQACAKYEVNAIYLAIPSATPQERRDILRICNEADCELKNLPGYYQLYSGEVTVSRLKPVQIEDLLGREQIRPEMDKTKEFIRDKVVLVTGVGSIGSALCRQIASFDPKHLIMFDVYENNAYDIQMELKKKYPDLKLDCIIGSVRDSRKIFKVFHDYRPEVVFHAAAHKHVPLMEDSPCEAIKNNVLGTYKTAFAALLYGCSRFVLISTDKAVNPTNIMGASKRLCEMIIQAFDYMVKAGRADELPMLFTHSLKQEINIEEEKAALRRAGTEFAAVRFGNVLGSNGSVIPLFKRQIEAGGPVTVTHPDIIRYFMTIPEAVSLVLLAGTSAGGGEIFVLDMGEPVKIDSLARNLIRLSGLRPDIDIRIEYTGLRPGEKLYEEKLMAEEGLKRTDNNLIHIGCPIPFDIEAFLIGLNKLMDVAYANSEDIRDYVQEMVSTYHPA